MDGLWVVCQGVQMLKRSRSVRFGLFWHTLLLAFFSAVPFPVVAQENKLPFPLPVDSRTLPKTALIETSQGPIEIEFYQEASPITVRNFEYLSKKNFYNGLTFHRHKAGFVVQGGDPKGTGEGGPGYLLPPELSDTLKHERGTIGMARLPNAVNTNRYSNGSQFYIVFDRAPHLDGLYTVFAHVINGIDNAEKLRPGDKILGIRFGAQ